MCCTHRRKLHLTAESLVCLFGLTLTYCSAIVTSLMSVDISHIIGGGDNCHSLISQISLINFSLN